MPDGFTPSAVSPPDHLLRPEIGREGIAVGFAAVRAGRRAGLLNAAVAPGADVLQQAGLLGDLGKHRIGVGEKVLVRMRLVLVLVGDVLRGIFLIGFLFAGLGVAPRCSPTSCQRCSRPSLKSSRPFFDELRSISLTGLK